jgi:hypothetical protein
MSIFVSYSSADKAFVRRLVERLREGRRTVWLDDNELRPGDELERMIKRNIETADWFLLVASGAASNSKWVQKEVDFALEDDGNRKSMGLILVEADGTPWPKALPALAKIDFSSDFELGMEKLFSEIDKHQIGHVHDADTRALLSSASRRGLPYSPRPNQATSLYFGCGGYYAKCILETIGEADIAARATRASTKSLARALNEGNFLTGAPAQDFKKICELLNREIKDAWTQERNTNQPHIGARFGIIYQRGQEGLFFSIGWLKAYHLRRPRSAALPELTPVPCETRVSIDALRD